MKRGCRRQFKGVVLFMVLALAGIAHSAEYRSFKNQEGKAIHARIIQYDAEGGRVELELTNRKKAWVELSTLSAEDQAFIKQWQQDKVAEASKAKTLSEEEVRAIAEQYIKAWEDRDYQLWEALVIGPMQGRLPTESHWKQRYKEKVLLEIEEIEGLNVQLNIEIKGSKRREGWLQLLSDGRIKYTPLSFPHPLEISFKYGFVLYLDSFGKVNMEIKQRALQDLRNNKIPLFGYELDASLHKRQRSAKKILLWMIEEGETWDATDPKVPLPKKQLKDLIKEYRKYRGWSG